MSWFRLEDSFHSHPKVIAAGNAAVGLYVRCGTYSAQHLTDGFIPDAVARQYGTTREITILAGSTDPLWTTVEGGYLMADYLEFNPSKAQVLADRAKARERMNRGRRSAEHDPNIVGSSTTPTRPDPTPTTSSTQTDRPTTDATEVGLSVVGACLLYARVVYARNPGACHGIPARYIEGIATKARQEHAEALEAARDMALDAEAIAVHVFGITELDLYRLRSA